MFKNLFKKKTPVKNSKLDYWEKWEFFTLFNELHKAEIFLNDLQNRKSDSDFLKFKEEFIEELYEIEKDNSPDFTRIWEWFTPTKEWDKFTEQAGEELSKNIFRITDKWMKNHDFFKGMKVSLNNEFGVVLDKNPDDKWYGSICWDTDKENDIEEWHGIFGTFLDLGGTILSQEHEFVYINDDGTMKKK